MIVFITALVAFMFLCVVLCLVVLVQESKSLGLGASFGGDSGESVFGTSTASILKTITVYLITCFMVSCLLLSYWSSGMRVPPGLPPAADELPIE